MEQSVSLITFLLGLIYILEQTKGTSNSSSDLANRRKQKIDDLLENYDPRIPPNYEKGYPVVSTVQIYILSVDSISDSTMDYSMSMFIRQRWNDTRLMYTKIPGIKSLELDTRVMNNIWVPDLYVTNEKKASFHEVTVPNKLMHIYPDGLVVYSMRITGKYSCRMLLHKYPVDEQKCNFIMESYGYSTETLQFQWNKVPVEKDPNLNLPQFTMGEPHAFKCDKQYNDVNYTCIGIDFKLKRQYGYYLIQVYIPSCLIVVLSWLSFWLNIDAIPARISLGLLTVLTMTTQSSGARAELPRVSYVKAIDIWMSTCLVFVFAALVEFAYVNVLARVEMRKRASIKDLPNLIHNKKMDVENGNEDDYDKKKRKFTFLRSSENREKARTVDKVSRVVFPLVFILFNVVYWTVYLLWNQYE